MKPTLAVGQVWRRDTTGELFLVGCIDAGATFTKVNFFSLVDGNRFYAEADNIVARDHAMEDWSYAGHISEWSKK